MKQYLINIAIFATGAGIGFLVAKKIYETKYAQIAQEEIEDVKDFYEIKHRKFVEENGTKIDRILTGGVSDPDTIERAEPLVPNSISYGGATASKSRIAYHDLAKASLDSVLGIKSPSKDKPEPFDDEEESPTAVTRDTTKAFSISTSGPSPYKDRSHPYMISDTEYAEDFDEYDKLSLYYYNFDGILCDEDEDPIDNTEQLVGLDWIDALDEETVVWVRNEKMGADYEICLVNASYAMSVHGIKENMTPRERYDKKRRAEEDDEE